MERWLESRHVYAGRVFSVRVGNVSMADGTIAAREVVEHPGGVAVVPVIDDAVLLVRQYRVAIGREVLEIPAGKLEGNEEVSHRAGRELEEETGHRAGRLEPIGSIFASVGYTTEEIHLFLAFDLVPTTQALEEDEAIEVVRVPLDEVRRMVLAGTIQDAKTIIGVQRLFERG